MARTTHVKAAQQRYAQRPALDENGAQRVTPVMKDGAQRVTKHGKPVVLRVTFSNTTQPLPPETCDSCRKPIAIGTPYKWIKPKSGPYGGRKLSRHEACPSWQVWDYSSSLSARISQVQHDAQEAIDAAESNDDLTTALQDAAQAIRDLAEEKREAAQNLEDGFQHATSQSDELNQVADDLDAWADDVEGTDLPEDPEPEPEDCDECDGSGVLNKSADPDDASPQVDCPECDGTGQVIPDEPTDDQWDDWRNEARDAATSALDECPV